MQSSGLNMEARAIGANSYAARSAATAAGKDIAGAKAAAGVGLKNPTKDAAIAPGPKRT